MKLAYTLTEQSFIDYNLYHIRHSPSQRRTVRKTCLLLPLVLVTIIAYIYAITDVMTVMEWCVTVGTIVISALWYLFCPAYYRLLVTKQLKSVFPKSRKDAFAGKYILDVLDDRLRETDLGRITEVDVGQGGERGAGRVQYLYLHRVVDGNGRVPSDAFADEDEKQRFFERLEILTDVRS